MNFTLTQEQYEALIALARKGSFDKEGQVIPDQARALDNWLKLIEKSNNIIRSALWIQWQEVDAPLPPKYRFPQTWPPNLRYYLELISRPICQADVDQVIKLKAKNPVNILVTPDPGATVGWTAPAQYFLQ